MEFFLSFLLGLLFFYLYYRLVWVSVKVRSKELKVIAKYGKDSPKRGRLKRFKKFYLSRPFRFFLFGIFAYAIFYIFGKGGLLGLFIALIVANLSLFPWGWKRSGEFLNGGNS